ncbi:YadA-like family protein [Psychrobacter sp. CAL346-MNA-CIBAN-0220]|uniref:YadA-like family protein n=1 Tax=Psychrobacter sp. CAL346-MNA-CIBAN-0220 TaxID=3140457 RepID=UPI00332D1AD7
MNRNYKVVWNEALNCFTAVAEYAKARGKSSKSSVSSNATINTTSNLSSTGILRLSAIGIGLLAAGFGMQASAANFPLCIGMTTVECGTNATASSYDGIAIGKNAQSVGSQTIAIGGVSNGQVTTALGEQSIAIGANVVSKGASSIAIGGDDLDEASMSNIDGNSVSNTINGGTVNTIFKYLAKRDLVEPGQYITYTEAGGAASIAIGAKSQSEGALSTAVGTHANTKGIAASAFGVAASATKDGSVALGAGSLTDSIATSEKTMVVGGTTYHVAGNVLDPSDNLKTGAQVSVGSAGFERQIKNVAGGKVSADSTDAINGSQLHATNTTVNRGIKLNVNGLQKTFALGEEIKFKFDSNFNTTANSGLDGVDIGLADTVNIGTANSVSIDGSTGSIKGLTNTSFDGTTTYTGGQAATQEQLTEVNTNINKTIGKGINFGNGTTSNKFALGDTIAVTGDNNLTSITTNEGVQVKLNKQIDLGNNGRLQIGDTLVNKSGITLTGGDNNTVTLSSNGLNNGDNRITNVANAEISAVSKDAVNGSQLFENRQNIASNASALGGGASYDPVTNTYTAPSYTVFTDPSDTVNTSQSVNTVGEAITVLNTAVQTPLTFAGDNGTNVTRKLGEKLTIKGGQTDSTKLASGSNIGVVADGTDTLNLKLAKDLTGLSSAGFGNNVKISSTGLRVGDALVNQNGLTFISTGSPNNTVRLSKTGLHNGFNQITGVTSGGNIDTNAANIGDIRTAVGISKTEVIAGTNVSVTNNPDNNGKNIYTINAEKTTASAGSAAVTVTPGTKDTNNVTDYAIDLSQITKDSLLNADNAMQNVITQIDGNTVKTLDKGNNTANFLKGDNIVLTAENGGIKVATAKNLVLDSVIMGDTLFNTSGVTLTGANPTRTVTLTNNGLNNGGNKITNVADGSIAVDSTDAVNGGQLNNTAGSIASVIGGNAVNNGGIVTSTDIGGTGKDTIDEAISSVNNVAVAAKSTVTQGNNIAVTSTTNEDGSTNYQVATTDDINVTSVKAGNSTLNTSGLAIDDDAGNTTTVTTAGTTVTNAAGNSTSYGAEGFTASDNAGNSTTVNQTGVSFTNSDGATGPSITAGGIDAGTTVITNVASGGTTTTNAANIGDVLSAAAGSRTEVAAGSNVTNVVKTTGSNGQDIYTVNANGASASAGSNAVTVTAGTKNTSNVTDYAVDLSQASKDSLVKADNAMQTVITQVDGVNVNTLNKTNNIANFVSGDNIVLSNDKGSIKVATAQNLVVTSVKTGNTTVDNNGLTIKDGASITTNGIDAGNKVVTNVATGIKDSDAANVGQLNTIDRVVSGQIATIDRNVNELGYRIGEVEDDANAGISAAMAMSSLPQAYIAGKSMIGGGIASYNGESAVAIGVSRVSDNGRWVMKINGTADTQGNAGGAIGAGFHF